MAEQDLVKQYLDRFRRGLRSVPEADRDEMVREIQSHIAEATAAGTPLPDVLGRLGPAERLARAYTAEALLVSHKGRSRVTRWPRIIGLVAATSLPSLVVVSVLGVIAFGFTLAGAFAVLISLVGPILPRGMYTSSLPWPLSLLFGLALGAATLGIGVLAGRGLLAYVRFLIRTVRQVLAD